MDDDSSRLERALLSLDGLSIGDAFGQRFFFPGVVETADRNNLPEPPWHYTDDTEMAMAIISVLKAEGEIDQGELAQEFAQRFIADPGRGYGGGAVELLQRIYHKEDWKAVSQSLFGGSGSFGNGGAMRVAPLGAWFADDVDTTIQQAKISAEVTHAHHEGQIGAVAIALAANWAIQNPGEDPQRMIPWIIDHLEDSEVRDRIVQVSEFSCDDWAFDVANSVGCGHQVSAQDTVAFCLWLAAAHFNDYCEAMWTAARVGGDIDTNCAIVGGIVSLNVGKNGIPDQWKRSREELKW